MVTDRKKITKRAKKSDFCTQIKTGTSASNFRQNSDKHKMHSDENHLKVHDIAAHT